LVLEEPYNYANDAVLKFGEASGLHTWLAASRLYMNIFKLRFMIFKLGYRASVADHVFDQISFQVQIVSRVTEYIVGLIGPLILATIRKRSHPTSVFSVE
jgi:branched-subunit amino acid permease